MFFDKKARRRNKIDVYLHFLNIIIAMGTSIVQTYRIIREIKIRQKLKENV